MKNKLLVILVLLIFISCNISKKDERLLGEWHSMNYSDNNELRFYKDSIIIYEMGRKLYGDWNSKNSNINVTLIDPDSKIIFDEFDIEYKFNKDSSLVINESDTISEYPLLFNVKNRFQHLQKMLDLKIDLPHSENSLESSGEGKFNLELFIGFKDGKLKAKINNNSIDLGENMAAREIFVFMRTNTENNLDKLKFVLVADKNISVAQLDTIKANLRKSPIKNIFTVYRDSTNNYRNINWSENITWYGLSE